LFDWTYSNSPKIIFKTFLFLSFLNTWVLISWWNTSLHWSLSSLDWNWLKNHSWRACNQSWNWKLKKIIFKINYSKIRTPPYFYLIIQLNLDDHKESLPLYCITGWAIFGVCPSWTYWTVGWGIATIPVKIDFLNY
jgi:hypothetical protein